MRFGTVWAARKFPKFHCNSILIEYTSEKYKLMHEIEDDLHKIIQSSKTQSLITDFWK